MALWEHTSQDGTRNYLSDHLTPGDRQDVRVWKITLYDFRKTNPDDPDYSRRSVCLMIWASTTGSGSTPNGENPKVKSSIWSWSFAWSRDKKPIATKPRSFETT